MNNRFDAMRYNVPFVSQYEGITDPAWRWRGCGIVALHMVMRFWHSRNPLRAAPSVEALLGRGIEIGAYREGIGWTHRGLVDVARQFGYDGFNADHAPNSPTPKSAEEVWQLISDALREGPVLASVYHYLDPTHGGGHIIVITGVEDDLVSFNDPEEVNENEGKKFIARSRFLQGFKNRFIVIR